MKCCVPDCGNIGRIRDTNRQNDVTLHSFPKDPKYRAEWLEALSIPNYEPNCRSFVCSQHFKQTDIHVTKNGRKRIKYGAVPYIDESEAPAHKRVCTLCLTLDARMFQLSNKKLSIMYRDIIGMMPNNNVNDRLPMGICFECAAKLQAASAFKCKALISDTLLKEHFLTNEYLTLADVRKFYKKHPNLKTTLTKKDLFKFDNSNISTDFMTEPFVKIEMIPHNDVKEIETINLVENTSTVKDESNTVKSEVDFLSVDDNKSEYMDDDDCDERSKIDFLDNIVFIKNQIDINVENTQNFDDSIDLTTSVETDNAFGYGVEKQTNEDGMQSLVLKEDGSSGIEKQKKVVKRSRAKKTEEDQPARKKRKKKPYVRPSIAIDENVITITTLDHEQLKKEVMERKDSQRYIQSPFKCTVCYKWFPTQDKLERHAYKHSEECGPLVCAICHVRTKSARHMREHVKHQHTNEFACKLCPLVTRNRSVALGHVRFHAGNKYSCPRCSMEFEFSNTRP